MVPESADGALGAFLADPANLPLDLTTSVAGSARALGLANAVVYLADLQQRQLAPLNATVPALPIDASLAGWCYRTQSLRVDEHHHGGMVAWLPLVDGAERLGVLGVTAPALDPEALRRGRTLAALCALMITSKRAYEDSFVHTARTDAMTLPAEMLRAYLPPRTIGCTRALSTAVLEPAYELGGDAFEHDLTDTALHAGVLDAVGHDLASGLVAVLALAAARNARRVGADLHDLVDSADAALSRWLPDKFCTAIFARLDLTTGRLRWINCGHPPPLLIRDHRLVAHALDRDPEPPMGLPAVLASVTRHVHEAALEPGDRVLMYTDGVTEARAADGSQFGLDRFADYVIRAAAAGEPPAETLRRLIHSLLEAQDHRLGDDATILMFEWCPQPD
ncbi:PP2C family protein-serine/threonine phosphatase [Streptomyces sp. NPDC046939]|uniref:PP2C family protein-serine/threonine phosphatase n=1 Tax=Streptomyces sp. NPDC046939 TaxID=3155376 RepID=UPI0034107CEA